MDITDDQDGHVSRFGHLINSSPQGQETHLFFLNHFPPPYYLHFRTFYSMNQYNSCYEIYVLTVIDAHVIP